MRSGPSSGASKQSIRTQVWKDLERQSAAAEPGVAGYIPDFVGSEVAAQRLAELDEWRRAVVIKANPDRAQLPVRALALREGKRVYMAIPRLAAEKPFVLLDPARLQVPSEEAAVHRVAVEVGLPVDVGDMEAVDVVVCGSVAVNPDGVRLGK